MLNADCSQCDATSLACRFSFVISIESTQSIEHADLRPSWLGWRDVAGDGSRLPVAYLQRSDGSDLPEGDESRVSPVLASAGC